MSFDLKPLSRSTEEMFERFARTSLSPRGYFLNALLSDDVETIARNLADSHNDLALHDLLLGVYAVAQSGHVAIPPAPLVTLASRIHTASRHSTDGFEAIWNLLEARPSPKQLGKFLNNFTAIDESDNDDALRAATYSRLAGFLQAERSFSPAQLLPHCSWLHNAPYIAGDAKVAILTAACYLTMKNRPDFAKVATSAEGSEFLIHALSDPECSYRKVALRFVAEAVANGLSKDLLSLLSTFTWSQNPVQLCPVAYYEQFIKNWQALGGDPDQVIVKCINTLLTGLSTLKEEQKPLLNRLSERTRIGFILGTLIDYKQTTIEVIFALAERARNKILISNMFFSQLTNLQLTDCDDEPMITSQDHSFTFTHNKKTHTFTYKPLPNGSGDLEYCEK